MPAPQSSAGSGGAASGSGGIVWRAVQLKADGLAFGLRAADRGAERPAGATGVVEVLDDPAEIPRRVGDDAAQVIALVVGELSRRAAPRPRAPDPSGTAAGTGGAKRLDRQAGVVHAAQQRMATIVAALPQSPLHAGECGVLRTAPALEPVALRWGEGRVLLALHRRPA